MKPSKPKNKVALDHYEIGREEGPLVTWPRELTWPTGENELDFPEPEEIKHLTLHQNG